MPDKSSCGYSEEGEMVACLSEDTKWEASFVTGLWGHSPHFVYI